MFVSDSPDDLECSELTSIMNCEGAYQEVFSRAKVRELVLSYRKNTNPILIRQREVGEDIWKIKTYHQPLSTTRTIEESSNSAEGLNIQPKVEKIEGDQLEPEKPVRSWTD